MNSNLAKALTLAAFGCIVAGPASAQTSSSSSAADAHYIAHLQPMNTSVTHGKTTGEATFEVKGDKLVISVKLKGAPPGITHWQHFHGFTNSQDASCPAQTADTNGDHIIDITETEASSGTTMVPFDKAPAGMDVAHGIYPKASAKGAYEYRQVVSLKELDAAFAKAFDGQKLDLERRVVFIHGVPSNTKLPATVASLGPIPAAVTLPIACGQIERAAH